MYLEDFWVMINIVLPVACLLKIGWWIRCAYTQTCIWFQRETANFWKFLYWKCHKQFSVAFLTIVEFVGEVPIFAINDYFKCTNAVIKILLCFSYIWLPYSVMLCTMYLYISVHVSTVNHEWNDDFLCMRKTDGSSIFPLFSYVIFLILCKLCLLYFTLYGIHVYIHISVHTMEACNKDYYYYYYYYHYHYHYHYHYYYYYYYYYYYS